MKFRFRSRPSILTSAGLVLLSGCGSSHEESTAPQPVTVRAALYEVAATDIPVGFTVTGSVRPVLTAPISAQMMGKVRSVSVREGDAVAAGQTLVVIDSREANAALRMASAGYRASVAGQSSAVTALKLEAATSKARIQAAEAQVGQARAAYSAAQARRDLAVAGPRTQEVNQSHIAVLQAESSLRYAVAELDRTKKLYEAGAVAKREVELAQNQADLAQGQLDSARQAEQIAREGTRRQDLRMAEEGVSQAKSALEQAQAGLAQARAAALQVEARRKALTMAAAQTNEAAAGVSASKVQVSYAQVTAPFAGVVARRMVDPGSMALPGTPLLEIQGNALRLEAQVPEKVMATLHIGSEVTVTLDSQRSAPFRGKVAEVVPSGDPLAHTFRVKVDFGAQTGVRSGQFGQLAIETGTKHGLAIPASATWEREGLHYVYALDGHDIARLRIITLGPVFDGHFPVLSGLQAGDRVIQRPTEEIRDGVKVVRS